MNLTTFDLLKNLRPAECVLLSKYELAELQQLLLTMLDDILSVCDEYNISYSLGGGSVLGAVRHHGFIPWDDDLDINMSRKEYERFIPMFKKHFGGKYWVHTPEETSGYELLFARIRRKGTSVKTRDDFFSDETGAFIDVFISENTFENPVLRNLHGLLCQGTGFLLSCRKFYRARKQMMNLAGADAKASRLFKCKILIGFLISFGSVDGWRKLADRCNRLCANDQSRLVTVPSGRKKFYGELCERRELCQTRKAIFAGRECLIPEGSEHYLQRLYGDYQKIPPVEGREVHIYFKPFFLGDHN